jgi:uncharacterized membrane protein
MADTMTFPMTRQGVRDLNAVDRNVLPVSGGPAPPAVNMSQTERVACAVGGAALALFGLTRGGLPGLGLVLAGGYAAYRGLSGYCHLYAALGINTAGRDTSGAEVVYRAR